MTMEHRACYSVASLQFAMCGRTLCDFGDGPSAGETSRDSKLPTILNTQAHLRRKFSQLPRPLGSPSGPTFIFPDLWLT